jgi:hypothetical protein
LIRQKARAVSRDAGPERVFEALCVIVVISGFWPIPAAPVVDRLKNTWILS